MQPLSKCMNITGIEWSQEPRCLCSSPLWPRKKIMSTGIFTWPYASSALLTGPTISMLVRRWSLLGLALSHAGLFLVQLVRSMGTVFLVSALTSMSMVWSTKRTMALLPPLRPGWQEGSGAQQHFSSPFASWGMVCLDSRSMALPAFDLLLVHAICSQ